MRNFDIHREVNPQLLPHNLPISGHIKVNQYPQAIFMRQPLQKGANQYENKFHKNKAIYSFAYTMHGTVGGTDHSIGDNLDRQQ